jgi:hypothetical protein
LPFTENVWVLEERALNLRVRLPDSAKPYGNPVHGTVCRNTHEFPVVTAALIGLFFSHAENERVCEKARVLQRPRGAP